MSAKSENAFCAQAWMDMLWLRAGLAQSQEHNIAARQQLEQIRDESVLALWAADKALYMRMPPGL